MVKDWFIKRNCPDCDVIPGERHKWGCDQEQCCECGKQLISCDCPLRSRRIEWRGYSNDCRDCYEHEFACKLVGLEKDVDFIPCLIDDPDALPDVCRLYYECQWDKEKQKWVRNKQ